MDKLECYLKLYEIKKEHNENINDYVKKLALNEDNSVPQDVLYFINKYIPQNNLATYNIIYEKRHTNPLYKNLVNENSSVEDKAVALSSLLTQCMIRLKNINNMNEKLEYANEMNISSITKALEDYSYNGNIKLLDESFNIVRNKLKLLNK